MRRRERIDYKKLHTTGERSIRNQSSAATSKHQNQGETESHQTVSTESNLFELTESLQSESSESLVKSSESLQAESTASSQITSNLQQPGTVCISDLSTLSTLIENLSLEPSTMATMDKERFKLLNIEQTVIANDVDDIATENDVDDMTLSEVDVLTSKAEKMRTQFRSIHTELQMMMSEDAYENEFLKSYDKTLSVIKSIIKQLKNRLKYLRHEEETKQKQRLQMSITSQKFLVKEIMTAIKPLQTIFNKQPSNFTYDELIHAESNLQADLHKMDIISKHVRDMLSKDHPYQQDVDEVTQTYHKLCELKQSYAESLQAEVKKKEIIKQKKFSSSKLNIKLSKFKGYDSTVDIYSFQSDFEKLHINSIPTSLLPDLLKNNYLDGPALTLVKGVDEIDEIWRRLKASYGDAKLLLSKKLSHLSQTSRLWRMRDPEKQIEVISKILTFMKDTMKLANQHNIERRLYYSDAIEKIYVLLDDIRLTKWFTSIEGKDMAEPDIWKEFVTFLEKELSILQLKLLHCSNNDSKPSSTQRSYASQNQSHVVNPEYNVHNNGPVSPVNQDECFICGEVGHVKTNGPRGSKLVQYFSCNQFVQMTPSQRFNTLKQKGLCSQCLFPGADQTRGKHQEGRCQHDFVCPHPSHERFTSKKHILVCQDHATTQESQQILQKYKERCILRQTELPAFSKDIRLAFHTSNMQSFISGVKAVSSNEPIITNNAIYILQTITIDHQKYTIFYDLGCSDMVITEKAVKRLGRRASLEFKGDIAVGGIGQLQTVSSGIYKVNIPLHNGNEAQLSGVCLPQITSIFPIYQLKKVEQDIIKAYRQGGNDPAELPSLPSSVGGEIAIMLGIKYFRYHPKEVFQLESGLTILQSMFQNADGSRGVVGGPHQAFDNIHKHHITNQQMMTFFTSQHKLSQEASLVNPDVNLLHLKVQKDHQKDLMFNIPDETTGLVTRNQKVFDQVEDAGSQISYRCINCRNCKDCKSSEVIESISFKEEVEQHIINKSVTVDIKNRVSFASLPLLHDPEIKLANNKHKALKVYYQQIKKLDQQPSDKADVIASERKLQTMGFVDYVENLTTHQQQMLANTKIINFIPWRAVWKPNSLSTPCRVVFDASQPTNSGYSLNDILAKGTNNMNRLVEILIRWTTHHTAFHTDVRKMYNSVKLLQEHWCLQRYIWDDELDKSKIPKEKVIKTLIYGVKSSGNQSERALRLTGQLSKETYPEIYNIIQKDIYVDDCLSGEESTASAIKRADELQIVLNRGGFSLKGVTFSNQRPSSELSGDGESICVAGMKWYPQSDEVSLDVSELNFAKKIRGKKPTASKMIPINLTRRQCVSKVAELYDITGKVTPITASMKLDLHQLVDRGLGWDDRIPDDLRPIWDSHFAMMEEISTIKYRRAIIPKDATSLDINTVDTGDASKDIACVAIYARFQRKCGKFSCQLVFSRSKLIPDGTTQPRAELFAATLNAHTGEVVRRAFGKRHKMSLKLTDSQIVLYWINGSEKQLKPWVRNRVAEIHRFTNIVDWKFVTSQNMIADIGTRRGATLADVSGDSIWFNGFQWMHEAVVTFPAKTVDEIKLNQEDITFVNKEQIIPSHNPVNTMSINHSAPYQKPSAHLSSVTERYHFAQYIVDPNRYGWSRAINILEMVFKFINKLKSKSSNQSKHFITRYTSAQEYFYVKATEEIKAFTPEKKYSKISTQKDKILYYTGRILPTDNATSSGKLTNAMLDLTASSFFVPLVDRYSPIAFSIVNFIHWYHPVAKHAGVETSYRYVLQLVYIIDGRELVKIIRKRCERCRYLAKRTIEVEMGPVSKHNLNIAPPFYSTQVDLCGPFNAYSNFHKRTTVKIWLAVFCCTTTSATKIHVMDDYSTPSFIMTFIRFASEVGYPKHLLPDEGSQLVKGCETLRLSFKDIQNQLHCDRQVEFEVCPVAGHFMHGKVERKIQEVKKSLSINFDKQRLSVLQWETVAAQISNTINDMPLALAGHVNFEVADVLTPNRLLMGRNNDRSPAFPVELTSKPDKFMKLNQQIFEAWFEVWLTVHVPKLMHHPKWFRNEYNLKVGDIVLFMKQDNVLCSTYQYGKIKSIEMSKDGRIRRVLVEYRNHNENCNRETYRATRGLIMIHPVDELSVCEELAFQ